LLCQPSVVGNSTGPPLKKDNLLWKEERRERRRLAKQRRMDKEQMKYALVLAGASAIDVPISGIMVCVAFAHGYLDNGVSLYCLGLQALSHAISSLSLALRFFDEYRQPEDDTPSAESEGLLNQRRRVYLVREKRMSFVMGAVMLMSSVALCIKAVRKMLYWDRWYLDHVDMDHDAEFATIFLSWYGVAVYSGQALIRGIVAMKLQRAVVRSSVVASLVSLAYLFIIGAGALFEDEWSWKAEPLAAIVLGCFTLAEGARLIYVHHGDVDVKLQVDDWA